MCKTDVEPERAANDASLNFLAQNALRRNGIRLNHRIASFEFEDDLIRPAFATETSNEERLADKGFGRQQTGHPPPDQSPRAGFFGIML
jgi:hypothetical protein